MAQLFECFFPLMIIALFSFHTVDSASVQGLFGSQLNSNEELESKFMNWLTIHFRQQLDSEIERLNAEIKQLKVEVIDLKAKNADQETLIQRILYAQSVTNNNHQSSDEQRIYSIETRNDAQVLTPRTGLRPTSCKDVQSNRFMYSGYYLVGRDNKLMTVFCNLDSSLSYDSPGFETVIGYNDVKNLSSSVYFHVQRSSPYKTLSTPIAYQQANLNIGTAMNITTGVFTAPTSGVYYFSFVSISMGEGTNAVILRKNGQYIATSLVPSINYNPSLTATLKLNKSDQIDVYLSLGSILDDSNYHYTQFSGILLEEYLDL